MAPTMTSHSAPAHYMTPSTDAMDRHEYGIQKNRKPASTGGGRAWSEDEEVYLLQTRLQKMPYKHIASHLKKTELACRLHYHQLSHGSNRRKRTASVSTESSDSPILSHMQHSRLPSPIQENGSPNTTSPASYGYSPMTIHAQIQLPAILPRGPSTSPQRVLAPSLPVAILPKPTSPPRRALSDPLRLDCNAHTSSPPHQQIDRARLHHIYESRRADFWTRVAADYGNNVAPEALEQAWFANGMGASVSSGLSQGPPTPCVSPDGGNDVAYLRAGREEKASTGISVSALLGIDASPRSPKERELIRLMEEGRRGSINV